ncbi:MAG: RsmE family RNA methyltransferase [Planctomycetes bacterium]|nr:RsmE family RNA methyltransferase [Planctomycetota bacterium]
MNLVLLRPDEVDPAGGAKLDGRRAAHLIERLSVAPGRELQAGLLDGPLGTAIVERVDGATVDLRCRFDHDAPPRSDDTLILAVPRPKVLCRCVEHATALGFARIVVVRSWFTDKSHLASARLDAARLDARVIAGLEQSRRTMRPSLSVEPLFRPFCEDRLDGIVGPAARYVADPDAPRDLVECAPGARDAIAVAIGPERGFNAFEIDLLGARGFRRVHAGRHPLRVECAVTALFAQLDALRRAARGDHRAEALASAGIRGATAAGSSSTRVSTDRVDPSGSRTTMDTPS